MQMLSMLTELRATRLAAPHRVTDVRCLEWPPAGVMVTIVSGLFIALRPDSPLWALWEEEEEPSAEARALTAALCRPDGWEIVSDIGPDVARKLGGTGYLSRQEGTTVGLTHVVRFEVDEPSDQGTVRLLRPSRYLGSNGFWRIDSENDEGRVPRSAEWRMRCTGIRSGDVELLREGNLYFRAQLDVDEAAGRVAALTSGSADAGLVFSEGRVLTLEDVGLGSDGKLRTALSLGLAEYKVVGSFEARPCLSRVAPVE